MTTGKSLRAQAAAEMAAAMCLLDQSPLARAKGAAAANVRLNASLAVLCAYVAHRHLTGLETEPQEGLRRMAGSRLLSEDSREPLVEALRGQLPEDCWAVDYSNGTIAYHCDHESGGDRNYPCLSCPLVTHHLPAIVAPLLNLAPDDPPPQDAAADPIAAVRDASKTLDAIERAARLLPQCGTDRTLCAAAIAAANAAYYTAATVQWHPPHIGRSAMKRLTDQELVIADLLQVAMGGDPKWGSIKADRDDGEHCVRVLSIPKETVSFLCGAPGGIMPPGADWDGTTTETCANCHFHSQEHRSRIDQLAERAMPRTDPH